MWTDMSEIVRPTRDGIHGREYISTSINLGRKPLNLEFDRVGNLIPYSFPILEIPLPIFFGQPPSWPISDNILLAQALAAKTVGTFMMIELSDSSRLTPYNAHLIPLIDKILDKIMDFRMVEFADTDGVLDLVDEAKTINPGLVTSIRLALNKGTGLRVSELARCGAEVIHLYADCQGREFSQDPEPRFITEAIRDIHLQLVDESLRDRMSLIVSGGIVLAEHVAKIILCGADGAVVDLPLLIGLECRLCGRCQEGLSCPVKIKDIDPDWGAKRIINLTAAFHSQLIEVMGAMGIRETRRLRGEAGRLMNSSDLEREAFR